jgi:hypothetical protein
MEQLGKVGDIVLHAGGKIYNERQQHGQHLEQNQSKQPKQ